MVVYVNQTPVEFEAPISIQSVILQQDLKQDKGLAVAVNNEIIPKSQWSLHQLKHEDQVLIISATAGG